MRADKPSLIVTCEHAGNEIPRELRLRVAPSARVLDSHRGWDPGALELARDISDVLGAPLFAGIVSRLVVDLNRSLDNAALFSEFSAGLPPLLRWRVVEDIYAPYRRDVERAIGAASRSRTLTHVSVHTFTTVLRGSVRNVDVGLLFDPARARESAICRAWRRELLALRPRLRVAFNKPYKGTDDGFTTYLRSRFADRAYAGIELEVSQRFARRKKAGWDGLRHDLTLALARALANAPPATRRAPARSRKPRGAKQA